VPPHFLFANITPSNGDANASLGLVQQTAGGLEPELIVPLPPLPLRRRHCPRAAVAKGRGGPGGWWSIDAFAAS